jgi:hypothetical protein
MKKMKIPILCPVVKVAIRTRLWREIQSLPASTQCFELLYPTLVGLLAPIIIMLQHIVQLLLDLFLDTCIAPLGVHPSILIPILSHLPRMKRATLILEA